MLLDCRELKTAAYFNYLSLPCDLYRFFGFYFYIPINRHTHSVKSIFLPVSNMPQLLHGYHKCSVVISNRQMQKSSHIVSRQIFVVDFAERHSVWCDEMCQLRQYNTITQRLLQLSTYRNLLTNARLNPANQQQIITNFCNSELRFYVPLNTKQVISETSARQSLGLVWKNQN